MVSPRNIARIGNNNIEVAVFLLKSNSRVNIMQSLWLSQRRLLVKKEPLRMIVTWFLMPRCDNQCVCAHACCCLRACILPQLLIHACTYYIVKFQSQVVTCSILIIQPRRINLSSLM